MTFSLTPLSLLSYHLLKLNLYNQLMFNRSINFKTEGQNQQQKNHLFQRVFTAPAPPQNNQQTEEEKVNKAQDEGHQEFLKESAKEEEKTAQQLENLVETADFVLFQTDSANPIDPFPNSIIIDTAKVSIIYRHFFATERVHSVMIQDVSDVFIDTSPFFAKLSIVDKGFTENEVSIDWLGKENAIKARRVIQGLVVASQKGIDFGKLRQELSAEEIVEKIEKLGKARIASEQTTKT